LASFLRKITKHLDPRKRDNNLEKVFLSAFGKHPGWDDHIDDIGLETEILIDTKRAIYVQGIGGNIDSGSWDKLPNNHRLEKYKHVFFWCRGENTIVGRLWSSMDGKGRKSYPMVVCAQCVQLPPTWVLDNISPRLEKIEEICTTTNSALEVHKTIDNFQTEFRQLAQRYQPSASLSGMHPDALNRLAECPETGVGYEGLIRILYYIEREISRYHSGSPSGKPLRPTLLRVPLSSLSKTENMLLWISFLLAKFGDNASVLVFIPLGESWMDIILGEPTNMQLYCLRAFLDAVPLTSSIPYAIDSEFIDRAKRLIEDSRVDKGEETL
jgi:hypothetical protein